MPSLSGILNAESKKLLPGESIPLPGLDDVLLRNYEGKFNSLRQITLDDLSAEERENAGKWLFTLDFPLLT